MERSPGARSLSRGVVTLLWISAAGWLQLPAVCFAGRRPPTYTVEINNNMILLHPGTRLNKPDRQAFQQILSQYATSLYRIEYYKKGKLTRVYGELSEALIEKTIAAEAE